MLRVLVVLGLNATLKLIRPSSSSSSHPFVLGSADFVDVSQQMLHTAKSEATIVSEMKAGGMTRSNRTGTEKKAKHSRKYLGVIFNSSADEGTVIN